MAPEPAVPGRLLTEGSGVRQTSPRRAAGQTPLLHDLAHAYRSQGPIRHQALDKPAKSA